MLVENATRAHDAHDVHVRLAYTADDAEGIAEAVGVSLSDEESAVIVDQIDGELEALALSATEQAVRVRMIELVSVVGGAHDISDDD